MEREAVSVGPGWDRPTARAWQHHIYFYQPSHPWGAGVQLGGMLSPMALHVQRWYHLCVTRSGPEFAMFINGVLSSQTTDTNVIQLSGSFLSSATISQESALMATGDSSFHGNLDEICIYNRALSATEVQALYNMGSGQPALSNVRASQRAGANQWTCGMT